MDIEVYYILTGIMTRSWLLVKNIFKLVHFYTNDKSIYSLNKQLNSDMQGWLKISVFAEACAANVLSLFM